MQLHKGHTIITALLILGCAVQHGRLGTVEAQVVGISTRLTTVETRVITALDAVNTTLAALKDTVERSNARRIENPMNKPNPKQTAFLCAFRACPTVSAAARAAGINRSSHYRWLRSPSYVTSFGVAGDQATEDFSTLAVQRMRAGTARPAARKPNLSPPIKGMGVALCADSSLEGLPDCNLDLSSLDKLLGPISRF